MSKFTLYTALLILGIHCSATADTTSFPLRPEATASTESAQAKTTSLTWQYQGATDYEQKLPGYGVSYRFVSEADAKADIYVYDMGKKDWKTGIADADLPKIMDMAKNEIRRVQERGDYQQVSFGVATQASIDGQDFYVQPVQLKTEHDQISSFIYLSVLNHQLLKLRISFMNPPSFFDMNQISQNFLKDALKDLNQVKQPAPSASQVF